MEVLTQSKFEKELAYIQGRVLIPRELIVTGGKTGIARELDPSIAKMRKSIRPLDFERLAPQYNYTYIYTEVL